MERAERCVTTAPGPVDRRVEIAADEHGSRTTPSCVAFAGGGRWLAGAAALGQAAAAPRSAVLGARRLLGGACSAEVEVRSADGEARRLSPEELVSIELAALKARAARRRCGRRCGSCRRGAVLSC